MKRHKRFTVLAFAALLLAGFVASSIISFLVARDELSERIATEALPLTSDNVYSEIQRDLLRSTLISSLMAHDTFLHDWIVGGETEPARMRRYLREIRGKYDATTAFFVSERSHRYYHPEGVLKTVSEADPADAWYFRVRAMNDPYEINIDQDTADRSRLTIFVNYRVTGYGGEFLGAIGIGLSVSRVAELIDTYQRRYGRRIYFVDREGQITLHGAAFEGSKRIQDRPGLAAYSTRILANPSAAFQFERADGVTTYINSRLVPALDWHLIVEQRQSAGDSPILSIMVVNVAVAIVLAMAVLLLGGFAIRGYQRRLETMATTDSLTGAANRQVFEMVFDQAAKAARRRGESVSLLALDIDAFKPLNDSYGHQGGDRVMQELVARVRRCIREADSVCRWGGDEFVVLLGGCRAADAAATAEKIRRAVADQPVRFGREQISATVSIGVAELAGGESLDDLMARADTALYAAKEAGRDTVTTV
ncbi:GGDEF domain-containing protein [Ectothiorhodospiraceae bacterium WFHF3C12]|nr:GGDEF domain-containing protein [Ectothiorhodospiraceae bacterium WFHF3C12]